MRFVGTARRIGLGGALLSLLYAFAIRPRMLTWGATFAETHRTYPGDDVVPTPEAGATMAVMLPAPPDEVWRWLVQMGRGRAGWYSWDRIDNRGEPSADRIEPDWQSLKVGQQLQGPTNWWTVQVVEPCSTLVLRSCYTLTGHPVDPATDRLPASYVDGIWGFHLRPTRGGTRMVVRTRSIGRPRLLARVLGVSIGEPVHFFMQVHQFHNLSRRLRDTAATTAAARDALRASPLNRLPSLGQASAPSQASRSRTRPPNRSTPPA